MCPLKKFLEKYSFPHKIKSQHIFENQKNNPPAYLLLGWKEVAYGWYLSLSAKKKIPEITLLFKYLSSFMRQLQKIQSNSTRHCISIL